MPKTSNSNEKQVSVPSWAVGLGKHAFTALSVMVVMYIRLSAVEMNVNELKSSMKARDETIGVTKDRVQEIALKQTQSQTTVSDALIRIEANSKEIRADVKELGKAVADLQSKSVVKQPN